jgi:flagellar hook assembly protein FlgD
VKLTVYDVAGREVRTLSSGTREAGRYSAQWDGKDASGSKVSAGVYFYRLTAGAETLTRKMTVLK